MSDELRQLIDTEAEHADVPEDEVLRDSAGRVVDDAYVAAAVDAARKYVRGRSSSSPAMLDNAWRGIRAPTRTFDPP